MLDDIAGEEETLKIQAFGYNIRRLLLDAAYTEKIKSLECWSPSRMEQGTAKTSSPPMVQKKASPKMIEAFIKFNSQQITDIITEGVNELARRTVT